MVLTNQDNIELLQNAYRSLRKLQDQATATTQQFKQIIDEETHGKLTKQLFKIISAFNDEIFSFSNINSELFSLSGDDSSDSQTFHSTNEL
jgi:hypothetical protein